MTNEKIVENIKVQYNRDLRKQLVKRVANSEKMDDKEEIKNGYSIMSQIFSYILGQTGWDPADNSKKLDDSPLRILKEAFPNIESTKWFNGVEQNVNKSIENQIMNESK